MRRTGNLCAIRVHETSTWLVDDYHVARPHGILVVTSRYATDLASPRRLSAWDDGQCNAPPRPPLHADKRQWWRFCPIARDLVAASARRRQAAS